MTYKLKINIEEFRVVDGPFAGRRYKRDVEYAEIPPGEEKKFDAVSAAKTADKPVGVDHYKYEKKKPRKK